MWIKTCHITARYHPPSCISIMYYTTRSGSSKRDYWGQSLFSEVFFFFLPQRLCIEKSWNSSWLLFFWRNTLAGSWKTDNIHDMKLWDERKRWRREEARENLRKRRNCLSGSWHWLLKRREEKVPGGNLTTPNLPDTTTTTTTTTHTHTQTNLQTNI